MSGWDDVSTPAPDVAQPANSWDAVSSPVNTAVPDNSGLVKTVQDNLAPKPAAGGAESTEQPAQQTSTQKIDTGMGMPVSSLLRSGDSPKNDQQPLPADIRGHLVDAYAKGAATNAGDYMQSALPAVANAIERTGRAALQGTGMILGFIPDSLVRLAYTGAQAAGLIDKSKSVDDLPSVQKGFAELDVLPKNLAQNSIQEKADQMASMVPALAVGGGATLPTAAWRTLYMGAAGIFGPKASEAIGNWATEHFPDQPFIHESLSQMANFGTMLGIGGVGYKAEAMLPGHTALAPVVGDAIGKEAKDVTPQDINQTIAKGFENVAPKAQDFHDVAAVMNHANNGGEPPPGAAPLGALKQVAPENTNAVGQAGIQTADTLRNIYKETGVHPDQVFADARSDPSIAQDVAAGKVPATYDHLREPGSIESAAQSSLVDNQKAIQSRFADKLENSPDQARQEYNSLPETNGGKIINTDYARELSEDYRGNRHLADAVYGPASEFTKKLYAEKLQEAPKEGEENLVTFTAGGTGAGKSSGLKNVQEEINKSQIVYDTNMHDYEGSVSKVEQALSAGKNVNIFYVYRDPLEAYTSGVLKRAEVGAQESGTGRIVSPDTHIDTHQGSREVIEKLAQKYAGNDKVNIEVLDNSHGEGNTKVISIADLPKPDYSNLHGKLSDALEKEYAEGRISEGTYQGFSKGFSSENGRSDGSQSELQRNSQSSDVLGNKPPGSGPPRGPYDPEHPFEEGQPNTPQRSEEGASTSINPLAKILNPAGISESSKDMATAIRQGRGPADQVTSQIADQVKEHAATFNKMSEEDRLNFIQYVETKGKGAEIPEELKPIADQLAQIYERMHDEAVNAGLPIGYVENYHPHVYENEAGYQKFFNDWTAKQGGPRNLKERTFPTLQEAMEAGFKPKTTNPVEALMSYVGNMNNLIAANRSVDLAIKGGIADYFVKGEQPEGWVPLNGNLAERNGKTLFAPEDAARVYNNDISEKATGPIGDIADVVQRANNFASKLVLGLSGYHFTATTMASMASDVSRGTLGGVVSAITPFADTARGSKFINAYLGREELPPELQKALDLAVKNNTVNVRQPDYLKAGPPKDYVDAFKSGTLGQEIKAAGQTIKENPLTGPVKVLATEIGRTMDTISKPLFDHYIPRIKISANISELHDWLQDHPEASEQEMDRKAQEIGNSIDNRFGEMMRDNLFWHQLTRQTLQTALLSYSWVAGGARMLKGIPDTMKTALGKVGIGEGQELSSNAKYLFGMAATYAAVNGVRTYLGTGQAPDDWKDFIYPRTGGTTPQGKEEREILPSHIGQFTNYLHDGIGELGNEASPGLKLMYHLLANKDFRGLPITNENNSWFDEQRWGDYAKYVLHEETPIGLKNFLQGPKKGSEISPAEQALGVRQAPRFITDPEGYKKMMENVNNSEYKKKQRSDQNAARQYQNSEE